MMTETTQLIREDSPLNKIRTYFEALQKTLSRTYVFVADLKGNVVLLSDNFVSDFTFTSNVVDDFESRLISLIHPDDMERFEAGFQKHFVKEVQDDDHDFEYRICLPDGEYVWVRCKGSIGRNADGEPIIWSGVIVRMDIVLKADHVTGLLNRRAFDKALQKELRDSQDARGAVIVIGLDNFHVINETYGHQFGDIALKQIAQNITQVLPPDIGLYKLDGYMFGLFMPYAMPEEIEIIFSSVQLCMREIHNVEDTIYCTASAGAAFYPTDASDDVTLLRYAEVALEIARQKGRDQISFFSKETYDRWRYDIGMQNLMQNSIARGCEDFFLCYQPQVDAKDGRLIGAEALLRWYDKDGSVVAPMQFIPMLEKSRMIIPVGHWIIENAVITAKKWQEYMPDFQMSINISLYQLEEHMFFPFVQDCIERHQIDPTTLTFELTESQSVYDWEFVNKQFASFHELGIQIAMDDFGTGYSSLGFLKNFACNVIKIDRVFVQDILKSDFDRNLVKYTIKLCHSIGMKVCIEGVEEEKAYIFLRDECKADYIQGFFFGYPEMEDVFIRRLKK
ncbi:MAG: GGDEF and EAL domain-containing protein [Selenomonadaceae bacterium]|nr:GGDEF and EAL domain-containing protein [Selenomonadaceae bacterium]